MRAYCVRVLGSHWLNQWLETDRFQLRYSHTGTPDDDIDRGK